ncbi:MAG: hypothetical protein H8K08_14280 [Nitrospira sp.]|nr:hypothetical protein [Nitrospira sp.]
MNCVDRTVRGILGSALFLSITLSACGTTPAAPVKHRSEGPPGDSSVVQALQRQLREREKRIEELESQLNVLKLIDQDVEKQKKPNRPPATLTPLE